MFLKHRFLWLLTCAHSNTQNIRDDWFWAKHSLILSTLTRAFPETPKYFSWGSASTPIQYSPSPTNWKFYRIRGIAYLTCGVSLTSFTSTRRLSCTPYYTIQHFPQKTRTGKVWRSRFALAHRHVVIESKL